jgi:hypothetical protein
MNNNDEQKPDNVTSLPGVSAEPIKLGSTKVERPKIIQADAQGNIKADPTIGVNPAQSDEDLVLQPWPDGSLLKHGPTSNGYAIVDGNKTALAVARNVYVADLICKSVDIFVKLSRIKEEEAKKAAATQPPTNGTDVGAAEPNP